MPMNVGRIAGLLMMLFFFGCKSEIKEVPVKGSVKEVWLKKQDDVGNILDYYQKVFEVLSSSYESCYRLIV